MLALNVSAILVFKANCINGLFILLFFASLYPLEIVLLMVSITMFPLSIICPNTLGFKLLVENQLSTHIKTLRSDEGGEFVNHSLGSYLQTHGISHQKSCAYTPEQNGLLNENTNILSKLPLPLMTQSSFPLNLWPFAFVTIVYLINQLPSPNVNHKSPFEILFHETVNYLVLQTCLLSLMKPYTSHKLQSEIIFDESLFPFSAIFSLSSLR